MFKKAILSLASLALTLNLGVGLANAKNTEVMQKPKEESQTVASGLIPVAKIKEIISKQPAEKIILFARNFVSQEQAEKLVADLQSAVTQSKNGEFISLGEIFNKNSVNAEQAEKLVSGFKKIINQMGSTPVTENDKIKK